MYAPGDFVRRDAPSAGPTFCNGLGLLLHEQRRLRRLDPRRQSDRTLSPFMSLHRRVQYAAIR